MKWQDLILNSRFSEKAHKGDGGFAPVILCPGTSSSSAGTVSAEEHWEMGAIRGRLALSVPPEALVSRRGKANFR